MSPPQVCFDTPSSASFNIPPSTTYYYPCVVCLSDGTVASIGACRGHDTSKMLAPEPIELCPYCGK